MAFHRIMFLHGVPTDRLGQVIAPHFANIDLRHLRDDLEEIQGGEEALRWICDQNGIRWEWERWDYKLKQRLIEKLQKLVNHGIFVVLRTTSFPPALPAFEKTEGEWQPTRDTRSFSPFAHRGFTFDIERRKQEEQEHKAWQERNQPPTSEVLKPAAGPGYRQATLGPHAAHAEQKEPLKTKPLEPHFVGEDIPNNPNNWMSGQGTVRYVSDAERAQYKLTVKNGRLYDTNGKLFDTSRATTWDDQNKAIYVMDENGNLYASQEQRLWEFHHSSLGQGKPVAGAGEIEVKDGVLLSINNRSGHYKPTDEMLDQTISALQRQGLNIKNSAIDKSW